MTTLKNLIDIQTTSQSNMYAVRIALTFLSYHNENSRGIMHAFEGRIYSGRVSYLQHHQVHLEQGEVPLGMVYRCTQSCGKSTPTVEGCVSESI